MLTLFGRFIVIGRTRPQRGERNLLNSVFLGRGFELAVDNLARPVKVVCFRLVHHFYDSFGPCTEEVVCVIGTVDCEAFDEGVD